MLFFSFMIGSMFGFGVCAIFSTRQYDKGFEDARKEWEKICNHIKK